MEAGEEIPDFAGFLPAFKIIASQHFVSFLFMFFFPIVADVLSRVVI